MIECSLLVDDEEYEIGEFTPAEILPLQKALKASIIIDEEGRKWQAQKLYFSVMPPYFFISTDEID